MQGALESLFMGDAGCVVDSRTVNLMPMSRAEINPFPPQLAAPPWLLWSLVLTFRDQHHALRQQSERAEGTAACLGDLVLICPAFPKSGTQNEALGSGRRCPIGKRSVPRNAVSLGHPSGKGWWSQSSFKWFHSGKTENGCPWGRGDL